LFCTTKSESAEPIEQGVFPLSHDATDCPYKNALELKYKEWKKINCTKEKEWKNKLKNLHDKLELVSKEKTHLQKQLSVRDENEKIVTGVKGLFTHGQIKSLISQKKVRWSGVLVLNVDSQGSTPQTVIRDDDEENGEFTVVEDRRSRKLRMQDGQESSDAEKAKGERGQQQLCK
jgi:hypothetical protein